MRVGPSRVGLSKVARRDQGGLQGRKPACASTILKSVAGVLLIWLLSRVDLVDAGLHLAALPTSLRPSGPQASEGKERAQEVLRHHGQDHRNNFRRVTLAMPHYTIAGSSETSLFLMNLFSESISAQLTAYSPGGRPFSLLGPNGERSFELRPRRHVQLSLHEMLAGSGPAFRRGSVTLEYEGEEQLVGAWAVVRRGSQAIEIPFQGRQSSTSSELISFWDLRPPTPASFGRRVRPRYVVLNTSNVPLSYSVILEKEGSEVSRERGSLQPHARHTLSPWKSRRGMAAGGLRLRHEGLPGDLLCVGLYEGQHFLSSLPVADRASIAPKDQQAVAVPLLDLDGRSVQALLSLWNAARRARKAEVSLFERHSGRLLAEQSLRMPPGGIQTLDLSSLLPDQKEGEKPAELRIAVRTGEKNGSLLASARSLGSDGRVIDAPFFQGEQAHHNGMYPLPSLRDHRVFTTLLNLGDAPASVVAQIDWEGGSYALPVVDLAPGASHRFDFGKLMEAKRPDLLGRELDPGLQGGFFHWSARSGSARLLARTEYGGHARGRFGFNCAGCCLEFPYGEIVSGGSPAVLVGLNKPFEACEYRTTCSGTIGPFRASTPSLNAPWPFNWNGTSVGAWAPGSGLLHFTAPATQFDWVGFCLSSATTITSSRPVDACQVRAKSIDARNPFQATVQYEFTGPATTVSDLSFTAPGQSTQSFVVQCPATISKTFDQSKLAVGHSRIQLLWTFRVANNINIERKVELRSRSNTMVATVPVAGTPPIILFVDLTHQIIEEHHRLSYSGVSLEKDSRTSWIGESKTTLRSPLVADLDTSITAWGDVHWYRDNTGTFLSRTMGVNTEPSIPSWGPNFAGRKTATNQFRTPGNGLKGVAGTALVNLDGTNYPVINREVSVSLD